MDKFARVYLLELWPAFRTRAWQGKDGCASIAIQVSHHSLFICLATSISCLIAAWKGNFPVTSQWRLSECIYEHPWIQTASMSYNPQVHDYLPHCSPHVKPTIISPRSLSEMSNSPFDPPAAGASASVNRSESPAIPGCSQDVDTTDNSPQTPCYDLPVSPPIAYSRLRIEPSETICLPSYHVQQSAQEPPPIDMGLSSPKDFPMMTEELPAYSKMSTEEPNTLAKALWKWGFLCPLLWFIGMTM